MIEYKIASANSIIIYFGKIISDQVSQIVQYNYNLLKKQNSSAIIDITPSYTSILIHYDLQKYTYSSMIEYLKSFLTLEANNTKEEGREIEIPVFYSEEVGFDLKRVAQMANLNLDDVIELHSNTTYSVYTIGFLPGFAYLGEVNSKIATPRLETPRTKIPKGSLGIADNQSAIYPVQSPGGWNIIGRTHLDMFDKNIEGFSYLNVGDRVRFKPISKEEFIQNGGVI